MLGKKLEKSKRVWAEVSRGDHGMEDAVGIIELTL